MKLTPLGRSEDTPIYLPFNQERAEDTPIYLSFNQEMAEDTSIYLSFSHNPTYEEIKANRGNETCLPPGSSVRGRK